MTTTTKRYGLVALCLLLAGLVLMATLNSSKSSASPSTQAAGYGQAAGSPAPAGGYGYGDSSASPAAGAMKPGGQLAVRMDAQLGAVLTDSQGFTLYRFDKDTAKPPASNCSGGCATTWPPVGNDAATVAGTGVEAAKLGDLTRADGTHQLTVGGWPAYRYAQDTAPGDTKGQGVGGTWFALAPDGTKAKAAASGDTQATPAPANTATAMPQPTQPSQSGAQLSLMNHPQLGQIMVDANGMTLYHFAKDTAWPMKSNCDATCLKTWKPAPPVEASKIKGIDPKLVGKMQRPDGSWQLSINCTPAYTYTGDQNPGDALGNGIGGVWSAINAQGKAPTGK
ncbi:MULTISPECIES: SCO0930 family lipoprotein [Kitasatospora]|uniref:Lipoprotein with Yx(FWY)xxD motif n=2 Tax=Kitasatospora TaxID=2063 RepID=A0ABT1J8B4_9ACTN|nr:SCO0930 family lipoprotein [Kitasatospora paracochleata]MCP2313674.1 putative lipoprotein with Yx(FWY)xxD motif [Kitasatospora paracochleata]